MYRISSFVIFFILSISVGTFFILEEYLAYRGQSIAVEQKDLSLWGLDVRADCLLPCFFAHGPARQALPDLYPPAPWLLLPSDL